MTTETTLRDQIRDLVKDYITCAACGNADWEQFLYVGDLPDGGVAGCKKCAHVTVLDDLIISNWKPSESDLSWTRDLIALWADGATWITSFAVFHADKQTKTLTVMEITQSNIIERELAKVRATFKTLGWTISEINSEINSEQMKGSDR